MSFKDEFAGQPDGREKVNLPRELAELEPELLEPELKTAIRDFRLSVNAWSEAVLSRPRQPAAAPRRLRWRLAAGWALGCALVAASVSGGVYEQHQRQESARMAAAHVAQQARLAAEQQLQQAKEEDLLAKVDSDVSRESPAAMEPLARLMAQDEDEY